MLRLVAGASAPSAARTATVALWGLDPELAGYVDASLRARWSQIAVVHLAVDAPACPVGAALWICAVPPPEDPGAPVLWLGDLDRSEHASRLSGRLWTCSMPITGRKLWRCIAQMQALPMA